MTLVALRIFWKIDSILLVLKTKKSTINILYKKIYSLILWNWQKLLATTIVFFISLCILKNLEKSYSSKFQMLANIMYYKYWKIYNGYSFNPSKTLSVRSKFFEYIKSSKLPEHKSESSTFDKTFFKWLISQKNVQMFLFHLSN